MNFRLKVQIVSFTILALSSQVGFAQKKKEKYDLQDKAAIIEVSKATIIRLLQDLAKLGDTSETDANKNTYILQDISGPTRIFTSGKALIEQDQVPENKTPQEDGAKLLAQTYLNEVKANFHTSFNSLGVADSFQYKIFTPSCIKTPKKDANFELEVFVEYTQKFSGVSLTSSTNFQTVRRVAELLLQKDPIEKTWKAYIANIGFYDTTRSDDGTGCYDFADGVDTGVATVAKKSNEYYEYMLKSAAKAISESRFVDAYMCIAEVAAVPEFEKRARELSGTKLFPKIIKSGIDDPNTYLANQLKEKGDALSAKSSNYEALRAYYYAYQLNPTSTALSNKKSFVADKYNAEQQCRSFYLREDYVGGIEAYKSAIADDGGNPNLYSGLALCYGKTIGGWNSAERYFQKAIEIAPNSPTVYKDQGMYYKEKLNPQYELAYKAFSNAEINTTDRDNPDYVSLKSTMIYCKAMALIQDAKMDEAIDSFRSALIVSPKNYEALCQLGQVYAERKLITEALEYLNRSVNVNNQYGEGYYQLGKTYAVANAYLTDNKHYSDSAIAKLRTAVQLNGAKGAWYLELGNRLLQHKLDEQGIREAITYFTYCIDHDTSITAQAAYRGRGDCYYYLADYTAASADYNKVYLSNLVDSTFCNRLGFLNIKINNFEKAAGYFETVINQSKTTEGNKEFISQAYLGKGEVTYLLDPKSKDKEKYLSLIETAFKNGISREYVDKDIVLQQLNKEKEFRKLKRKYSYR